MNCKIVAIDDFSRDVKRLAKKYASLKGELKDLEAQLLANPRMGILIRENTYKIRLAVKSKGRGKSGGCALSHTSLKLRLKFQKRKWSKISQLFWSPFTTNLKSKRFRMPI